MAITYGFKTSKNAIIKIRFITEQHEEVIPLREHDYAATSPPIWVI